MAWPDERENHYINQGWLLRWRICVSRPRWGNPGVLNVYVQTIALGPLPDTQNCGLRMHRECQERDARAVMHARIAN